MEFSYMHMCSKAEIIKDSKTEVFIIIFIILLMALLTNQDYEQSKPLEPDTMFKLSIGVIFFIIFGIFLNMATNKFLIEIYQNSTILILLIGNYWLINSYIVQRL